MKKESGTGDLHVSKLLIDVHVYNKCLDSIKVNTFINNLSYCILRKNDT